MVMQILYGYTGKQVRLPLEAGDVIGRLLWRRGF